MPAHRKRDRYRPEDRGYESPCWTWLLQTIWNGYGRVRVNGRYVLAHRYLYEQAGGTIPDGMQLDHLCRNRDCVNPDHLEPVHPAENTRRGRSAKLTPEQVDEIRTASGSQRSIAALFGVSQSTVWSIRSGDTWKPIPA